MSYFPINNLNLNVTQIGVPAQSYSAANTVLTLSGSTNQSVVTLSGNNIVLPRFRSYFIWANVPFQGSSSADNPGIGLYNSTLSAFEKGSAAYQYYPGGVEETSYSSDIISMLIDTSQQYTLQIKDSGGLSSTVTIYNNNSLRSDSNITILYTDQLTLSNVNLNVPTSTLVALTSTSQLTSASLNKYTSYSLINTGYVYWLPTTPAIDDIVGFMHLSGVGNFAVEYPSGSGTYLTGGFISSASVRKTFIFRWDGTTWVDIGRFTVI
jgi:hypothetical protein